MLTIISSMVAIVLPLCRRSNDSLKLRQHCHDIVQTIRFAIDTSEKTGRSVRFIFDEANKSYHLEIETGQNQFEVYRFTGGERYLDESVSLFKIDGFQQTGAEHLLLLAPCTPWPSATITLAIVELTGTVEINGRNVQYKEKNM